MDSTPSIALLTDFGATDPFVGIMKGVIARLTPPAKLIDLTHNIPPGDILRGAMALWQAKPFFPANTVYLCVVDPGVGTTRRGLYVRSGSSIYIGPDNGLFTFVLDEGAKAWELSNREYALSDPSSTFHGRDVFAPAAAYAAQGKSGESFGPTVSELVRLPNPHLEIIADEAIRGEVLYADRFGNLLTSIGRLLPLDKGYEFQPWLPGMSSITTKKLTPHVQLPSGDRMPVAKTFAEIAPGSCAGLIGSTGLLEIAANRTSAADMLDLHGGERITLTFS